MPKTKKSLITLIPEFIDYCKEIGLSTHTQENYKRYLNKFILWLKANKKTNLRPHQLSLEDISNYRNFLAQYRNEKDYPLKKSTQNYYLIALRALLSYFSAKDIICIVPNKIQLLKSFNNSKDVILPNLEQIEKILLVPDVSQKKGLRDRAILETIIFNGFKISRVVALNRTDIGKLSQRSRIWVEKYLRTRRDNNEAMFIHYRSKKGVENRLTPRSVQRIVKKCGKIIGLPFPITPEILRKSYVFALLSKQDKIEIRKIYNHQTILIKEYKERPTVLLKHIETSSNWNVIEKAIKHEIRWLKEKITVMPERYNQNPFSLSNDLLIRKIAILIVSGKIKAFEWTSDNKSGNIWGSFIKELRLNKTIRHGKEWHRKMMNALSRYFQSETQKIKLEPPLYYGRADLGVNFYSDKTLYIEIGSVSLYKLWHNLSSMEKTSFLIVPAENYAIEFIT